MIRWVTFGSFLCFLMAGLPACVFGQSNPYGNASSAKGSGADPRVRRANREQAVAIVGPKSRDFVETYGDEAVAAIFACSRPVALKLVEFHSCGEMGKLPRPGDLLCVIAQPRHCDDVAVFAIRNVQKLCDVDCFDAYLLNPLDYALGLRALETGAAEVRARRLNQTAVISPPARPQLSADEKLAVVGVVGFAVIAGILLWRRRQSSVC
jgi:hypothetical protein